MINYKELKVKVENKLIEIFTKIANGEYTRFDELEDFATSIIEFSVIDKNEKENAKLMIKTAREIAEKNIKNNN